MKTPRPSTLRRTVVALLLIAAGHASAVRAEHRVVADPRPAIYPAVCKGRAVTTGLCLLGAIVPRATGDFLISIPIIGPAAGDDIQVPLNTNIPLPPGDYVLYQASGLDDGHRLHVVVTEGEITRIKTATMQFLDRRGSNIKLQHYESRDGANGAGCEAEIGNRGVHALLPGTYQASLVSRPYEEAPRCVSNGVTFNVMAGKAVILHQTKLVANSLVPGNRFHDRSRALGLTNVDSYRHGVSEIGFLPVFQSHRGVHYPSSARVSALVLSGPPNFVFAIPMKVSRGANCGLSLEAGGLPAHVLLTDCVFDSSGDLTSFKVNAGNYYAFDNTHGKSAVAGHSINSPVVVRGVKFNLRGQ